MRLQPKRLKLLGCRFGASGIFATVEMSGNRQSGLSSGGADKVQDFLITIEWFTGPVLGNLGKEAMLNGVPFGSARRVMGNGESQAKRIGQLRLELGFPSAATITVTAAGIAEYEKLSRARIAKRSLLAPPMSNGVSGEGGCVMGDADHDGASIGEQIINAVRDGNASGVGAEVVVLDSAGRPIPARAGILEVAHQFALLGVDANDG